MRLTEPSTRDDMPGRDDGETGGRLSDPSTDAEHPRVDPRFAVEFDEFPGGWPGWRRAFKRAAVEHVTSLPELDYRSQDAPGHYAHQQLYYAVKSRVNAAAHRVAEVAEVEHRNFSLWLVKQRGFPWRQDCSIDDLLRLLEFLRAPETIEAARSVPHYPR